MKWFSNLRTGMKLGISFFLLVLIMGLSMSLAYNNLSILDKTIESLYTQEVVLLNELTELRGFENASRIAFLSMLHSSNKAEQEIFLKKVQENTMGVQSQIQKITMLKQSDPQFSLKINEFKKTYDEYKRIRDNTQIPLLFNGKVDAKLSEEQQLRFEKFIGITQEMIEDAMEKSRGMMAESKNIVLQTINYFIIIVSLSVIVASLLTILLSQQIAAPLKEISVIAKRVAGGDLSQTHFQFTERQDEVGVLSNAISFMIKTLRNLTAELAEVINILAASANEISAATTQLAASATETATSVNETSSTIEEVRQTSQMASQKAKSVADAAQKTTTISQSGKKAATEINEMIGQIHTQMESIAESMVRLNEQSQTIGSIIAAVEDLAQQSNLLAVNASIEAAKAGEQGKGFSVVAQEVKSLAIQSKQATGKIKDILGEIQKATTSAVMATEQGSKSVDAGVKKSNEAGESILTLVNSVSDASNAAMQIATISHQQLVGMDQTAIAMESIKQASTQNVDSAKQLELAASNIKDLGMRLKQLVSEYKLEAHGKG